MKKDNKKELFFYCFRFYQVCHTIFNIIWSIRLLEEKFLWWAWWGIAGVFFLLLIGNKDLSNYVNEKKSSIGKIITVLWIVSGGISGNVHSPRF